MNKMDRIPNNKPKDTNLCSITGCVNHRVYYYPQKNLKLCKNCWQDFLIDIDLDKIDTPDSALQNIKKIETWLSTMKKHGASYYITKIYDNFYVELGKYEQKLDEIRGKLDKAKQDDDFMEYPKIEDEALELLRQLCASNVMQNYKSHSAQMRINIIANENYIEVQDPFESEIRDKHLAKMKEDLTKELKEMNSKALEEEKRKLSDQFSQIFEDQKKKIEELEITVRDKLELIDQFNQDFEDQKKKTNDLEINLREKQKLIEKHVTQINNCKNEIENIRKAAKSEEDKLTNQNSKLVGKNNEYDKSIDKLNEQNKEHNNTIAKLTEDCKQKDKTIEGLNEDKKQSNATIDQLNSEVKEKDSLIGRLNSEKNDNEKAINKFKLDKKEQEELIDKLNEESKTQKAEIEKMSKCFTDLSEYLPQFYKSKTGRDGKTASDFYLYVDCREDKYKQVLQVAKCVKFSEMRKIEFDNLNEIKSKEVLDYLVANCPDKLKIFALDSSAWYCSAEYYIKGIKKTASVTSKEVFIRCFKFSKSDFEQTVKTSANSQRIVFHCCGIDPDADFDFSGPTYTTSYLGFRFVGSQSANNWKTHPERLKRIVKAISECLLKDSLNTIDVIGCNVEVGEVEKMLDEFALKGKVKVVQEGGWSLDE